MPRVTGLFVYPVKSCRGYAVSSAAFDEWGFVDDRRYLIVGPDGQFFTQRQHPRLARIETRVAEDSLCLAAPGASEFAVPRDRSSSAETRQVTVWRSTMTAEDCGDQAAHWLTAFLGTPARLVRMGEDYRRPVSAKRGGPDDEVSFADGAPFLLASEESLHALNDRIVAAGGDAVTMDRFRPNIVVSGAAPFAEDAWPRFRLGEMMVRSTWPCGRCIVTTTDQQTGERTGKEPLKTLATFRRDADDPTEVNFGLNLVHETKHGTIRVGDKLTFS